MIGRQLTGLLLTALLLWAPVAHAANTHGAADALGELRSTLGDVLTPGIVSGCAPSVPSSSLTLAAFACTGYVAGASAELVYVTQASQAVGPLNNGNGTYWLALHRDTSTSVSTWTRQSGSSFLWKLASSQPSNPSGGLVFAQVTVAGGVISAVSAPYNSYAAKLGPALSAWVAPEWYGADPTGVLDSTLAWQAALNTGKHVRGQTAATYKLTNSLYIQTSSQEVSCDCILTMNAGLALPALWIGATDASGTAPGAAIYNVKVRSISFVGTGTKTLGSAGIAFGKATTTTLDSVRTWGWYAGIDIRGNAIVNHLFNVDSRLNVYGLYDNRHTGATGPDFQASVISGGRWEANESEGLYTGSSNLKVQGAVIEGNGSVNNTPEITLLAGYASGHFDLVAAYMEAGAANTSTSMIKIGAGATRDVTISGGDFYVQGLATRYMIESLSAAVEQSYVFLGGYYRNMKNYCKCTITNNSQVVVLGSWTDTTKTLSTDLTIVGTASYVQMDRPNGLLTNGRFVGTTVNGTAITGTSLDAGSGAITGGAITGTGTVTGNSAVFNAAGGLPTLGLEEGPGTFNTWTGGTLGYGTANANIYTAKNSGEAAVAAGVSDGTNNHRAKLFVDNTNSVWGLYETFSLGNFPFVIARGNTELFRLTSVGVATIPDLKNTGSAGGKKVVCVDTATGTLYASSTGTDCSN